MRLFIAIQLPDAAAERASTLLPGRLPALRRVPASQLHVTLAFLGDTAPERLDDVRAAARSAARGVRRFEIALGRIGRFPASGRPITIWLGAEHPGELVALAERLRDALRTHGLAFDEKPFRPHVTLARVREHVPPAEAAAIVEALRAAPRPTIVFRADDVRVVQSTLSPTGARHEVLVTEPLEPGPAT